MKLRIVLRSLGSQVDGGVICWDETYVGAGLAWEDESAVLDVEFEVPVVNPAEGIK